MIEQPERMGNMKETSTDLQTLMVYLKIEMAIGDTVELTIVCDK